MERLDLVNKALGTDFNSEKEIVERFVNKPVVDLATNSLLLIPEVLDAILGFQNIKVINQRLIKKYSKKVESELNLSRKELSNTLLELPDIIHLFDRYKTRNLSMEDMHSDFFNRYALKVDSVNKMFTTDKKRKELITMYVERCKKLGVSKGQMELHFNNIIFPITPYILSGIISNIITDSIMDAIVNERVDYTIREDLSCFLKTRTAMPYKLAVTGAEIQSPVSQSELKIIGAKLTEFKGKMKEIRSNSVLDKSKGYATEELQIYILEHLDLALKAGRYGDLVAVAKGVHIYKGIKYRETIF